MLFKSQLFELKAIFFPLEAWYLCSQNSPQKLRSLFIKEGKILYVYGTILIIIKKDYWIRWNFIILPFSYCLKIGMFNYVKMDTFK